MISKFPYIKDGTDLKFRNFRVSRVRSFVVQIFSLESAASHISAYANDMPLNSQLSSGSQHFQSTTSARSFRIKGEVGNTVGVFVRFVPGALCSTFTMDNN